MLEIRKVFVVLFCLAAVMANGQGLGDNILTEASVPPEDIYIDGIVKEDKVIDRPVMDYEPIRKADIGWQRTLYREIDTREKINLTWRYPEEPFFEILRELSMNGDIVTFEDNAGYPNFKTILPLSDIEQKLFSVDSTVVTDPDTYEEKIEITRSEIFYEDINRYRIKEVWYFDEQASRMKNRIIGIAPIIDRVDPQTGEKLYTEVLFWIHYPTARKSLGKYRVYNEHNSMAPMSWTDLLDNRYFSSYIYKGPNILNSRIKDIYSSNDPDQDGIDRLLESERIKAELFNFEHDLWEY